MTRYFLKALSAHLRGGGALYVLTVLGVALGVASALSIQIINRNALGAFKASLEAISGEADLSVLGRTPTFPERLFADVVAEPGVARAWPLYRIDVALADREALFLEVVGVDFFAPLRLPWDGEPGDLSEALVRPGWVAVSPALAEEMGWAVGDAFMVTSGSKRVALVVGALVDFQEESPLASRKLAVMDIAQAQSLLGRPGQIHQIDVRTAEGTEPADLAARLHARLGPAVQVLTPEQREQEASDLLGAFRLNLTALSLVSLFVGLFLVHTSIQASLVRRRGEFGLLRSLGASRPQVFGLIVAEVALLGVLGVAVGLPVGYWAAATNVEVVSNTLTNIYLLEEIESLALPRWLFGLAVLIGIGGATAGSLLPAVDMSRKDTKALLAAYTLHERTRSLARPLFGAGGALLAATGLWFWLAGQAWKPGGFVLGIALLLALPLLTPLFVQRLCGAIPVRSLGLGYSLQSLQARLQTTAFAVSALAVAVSMLVAITFMIGSFRRTVEVWAAQAVRADVYVSTDSWRRAGHEATLSPEVVSALAAHPGVAAVDRLRRFFAYSGKRRLSLAGVDMALPGGQARFPLLEGDAAEALRQVRQEGAVLIGEPLARKAALGVGDRLALYGPAGERTFPIAGVYYDYTEGGSAAMDHRTMTHAFGPGPVNSVGLYLEPGLDAERVVDELKERFADFPLRIRSNRRLREDILAIFDQTFAVTRILQVMSLLIAVGGITLTLLVQAQEGISELALYRALGARREQIFRIYVGKGLGMGLLGLGLGSLGGIALAGILIFLINPAYFGWTIQVSWPWGALTQQATTILAAAALASLYPAVRASRTPATELSRDDL